MRWFFPRHSSFPCARQDRPFPGPSGAFSLIEVMVALAIVVAIMVAVLEVITGIEHSWKSTASDPFAEAKSAFSTLTQNLASATLEPYEDFADSSGTFRTSLSATFVADHLARRSDLDFICGPTVGTNGLLTGSGRTTCGCGIFFVAPRGYTQTEASTGVGRLLNAMGYFVEFGNDTAVPAFLLPSVQRWRWRLKEVRQPAESLQVFALASSSAWVQQLTLSEATTPTLAENIVALIILPERAASDSGTALSPNFNYDSRDATNPLTCHQLPARLRVAFMAIDEHSAQILAAQNGSNPPALVSPNLFQKATQLDTDLAALDLALTAQKIGHRLFQRVILLPAAAWSNTPSQ